MGEGDRTPKSYLDGIINKTYILGSDLTHHGACQCKWLMKMGFRVSSFVVHGRGNQWLNQEKIKCKQDQANDVGQRSAVTPFQPLRPQHQEDTTEHSQSG